jgi:predicted lipid carrier protein YhbT
VPFLTPAWCERVNQEAASLPMVEGATATLEVSVRRPAGVTGTYMASYRDGKPTLRMGTEPDADVRFEFVEEDYVSLLVGELDLLRAYAMGRIRVTGDLEAGMRVMPLMDAEPYRDLNRRIHGLTSFG